MDNSLELRMPLWRIALILLTTIALTGCVALAIDSAIDDYQQRLHLIDLGDRKEKFIRLLYSSQTRLDGQYKKPPEKFVVNGVKVEIYFMRSRRQSDGLTTDDEFTPYIFNNNTLVGIGWSAIGGPKTQGQTVDRE